MPAASPSLLQGLSVPELKQMASIHPDPGLPLIEWINQAHKVYLAAAEADAQDLAELAYVEYFKAAGILHLILNHPSFKTLKSQRPADYNRYLEVAPKVLSSTNRAKQLAETIERHTLSSTSSSVNAPRTWQIRGNVSSRINALETAAHAGPPRSPSPIIRTLDQIDPSPAAASSSSVSNRRPLPPPPPHPNGFTDAPGEVQANFVSTALETESTIRSGSAPPDLTLEAKMSGAASSRPPYDIGVGGLTVNGDPSCSFSKSSGSLAGHVPLTSRSPSEFAHAFPDLNELSLYDPEQPNGSAPPYLDLPNVPRTVPTKAGRGLSPPPEPFQIPSTQNHQRHSPEICSGGLVNDTSLGAGLLNQSGQDSDLVPGGPPPSYPDFESSGSQPALSSRPPLLNRSPAIRSRQYSRPSSLSGDCDSLFPVKSGPNSITTNGTPLNNLPTLPDDSSQVLPAVLIDYFRRSASKGVETRVLFLDVRERDDFETCRIKSNDVVCIEPLVLSKNGGRGVSSMEIEQSLVISPKKEQNLFQSRHEFDYVIVYDRRSLQFPIHRHSQNLLHSQDPAETPNKLLLLLYLAIHRDEYFKRLKRPPMLLSGGIEGWIKVAGEVGIVGKGTSSLNRQRQGSQTAEFASSVNGTPITFRHPLKDSGSAQHTIFEGQENSEIKRARRQVALVQREDPLSKNTGLIARSLADLTRPGADSHYTESHAHSTLQQNLYHHRPSLPQALTSNSYNSPGNIVSPITLPQQTLQWSKSAQPFQGSSIAQSTRPLPPVYPPAPSIHMPHSAYHSHPHTTSMPVNLGAHQPPFIGGSLTDTGYGSYLPTAVRPSIQYPQLQANMNSRPLQPPPPALTPAGPAPPPSYYNHLASYGRKSPRSSLTSRDLLSVKRETPPLTPYSPSRHGPSELYFNPSFEDGTVGLTGLKNLGNTCYMNSTLQCISATIPLARFFKDGSYKRCINRLNPLGTHGQLAESVAELVRVLWGAQYTFVSPITFREAICRFAPQFRGSDQHDAQEFLGFLLDGLHEDLNLVVKKPPPIELTQEREAELESLPTQLASAKEWEIYKRRDNSVIVELFQGQYRSRLQCLTCSTTSTTYNTFMYLSLPIPTKRGIRKVSLYQCLDAFLKEEVLEKDDAWNCPKCKTRRKATKRLSLARLPPILLIHLKRFSFKGPFSDKLETFVQYPVYGLDLTAYIPPPLNEPHEHAAPNCHAIYDLYAVCNHFGSLSSGHYTAFVRSQKEWYNVGDSRVSKTDEKTVKARSAYLLCLRRRDG